MINSSTDCSQNVQGGFANKAYKILGSVAPKGLTSITLTGGNNSTEHAVMDAIKARGYGGVIGFAGSNHG